VEPIVTPLLLVDVLLAAMLVAIAIRALVIDDLFQSVVLFIVFGVLMAVTWARLRAPDLALAEAAIGAGVTGALFLQTLAAGADPPPAGTSALAPASRRVTLGALGALAAVVGVVLMRAPLALPPIFEGLAPLVESSLAVSGASNPVTAVLLNFRAYDTLLEVVVLLVAVMGVWSIAPGPGIRATGGAAAAGPVLLALLRLAIPVIIVTAGYLLWIGTSAPGGAFQAGAVLCAAGVLLHAADIVRPPTLRTWPARATLAAGLVVFLAVAIGVQAGGRPLLAYPDGWAGPAILLIEAVLTVSIAATLAVLFVGGEQSPGGTGR
jgi:multisubunit Na+/H+ antiporter MnhB subunit